MKNIRTYIRCVVTAAVSTWCDAITRCFLESEGKQESIETKANKLQCGDVPLLSYLFVHLSIYLSNALKNT